MFPQIWGAEQTEIIHKGSDAMQRPLILASASKVRLQILQNAGIQAVAQPARVDEETIRLGLEAENAKPHDIADALAEIKARKIADKNPDRLVLGCDQVLSFQGSVFSKAATADQARVQLRQLRGRSHQLISAVVLYDEARPIWRHIGRATLTMREFSDEYLEGYLLRNWQEAQHSVGVYMVEAEGIRLFSATEGDHFTILGLPLLPLMSYLGTRGFIET